MLSRRLTYGICIAAVIMVVALLALIFNGSNSHHLRIPALIAFPLAAGAMGFLSALRFRLSRGN